MNLPSCNQLASYSDYIGAEAEPEYHTCNWCDGMKRFAHICRCGADENDGLAICLACGRKVEYDTCTTCHEEGQIEV